MLVFALRARNSKCFPRRLQNFRNLNNRKKIHIIIRSKVFFLFIGGEPTTWPANNRLQIMVCSCTMPSNCVWLQIIFCTCVKETVLFSFSRSLLRENGRSLRFLGIFRWKKQTRWSNDKTFIELGYCKISWFVSVSHINYLPKPSASTNNWSARHRQITIFCSTSSNKCLIILQKLWIAWTSKNK